MLDIILILSKTIRKAFSPISLYIKSLSYLSVAVLHRQPPVIGKLILAAGLNIAEDDGSQEPGGVVPDTWGYLS